MGVVMLLLYVVISFLMGCLLVGLAWGLIRLEVIIPAFNVYLHSGQLFIDSYWRWFITAIGTLIILICVRHLQSMLRRLNRDKSISFSTPQGEVCVTLYAIEDMIKKILESSRELSNIKPKVSSSRKKTIDVTIRSNLTSSVNLLECTNEIQQLVQEKLHQLLGEEREIKIKIEIRKMAISTREEEPEVEEDEPQVPFRNYVE